MNSSLTLEGAAPSPTPLTPSLPPSSGAVFALSEALDFDGLEAQLSSSVDAVMAKNAAMIQHVHSLAASFSALPDVPPLELFGVLCAAGGPAAAAAALQADVKALEAKITGAVTSAFDKGVRSPSGIAAVQLVSTLEALGAVPSALAQKVLDAVVAKPAHATSAILNCLLDASKGAKFEPLLKGLAAVIRKDYRKPSAFIVAAISEAAGVAALGLAATYASMADALEAGSTTNEACMRGTLTMAAYYLDEPFKAAFVTQTTADFQKMIAGTYISDTTPRLFLQRYIFYQALNHRVMQRERMFAGETVALQLALGFFALVANDIAAGAAPAASLLRRIREFPLADERFLHLLGAPLERFAAVVDDESSFRVALVASVHDFEHAFNSVPADSESRPFLFTLLTLAKSLEQFEDPAQAAFAGFVETLKFNDVPNASALESVVATVRASDPASLVWALFDATGVVFPEERCTDAQCAEHFRDYLRPLAAVRDEVKAQSPFAAALTILLAYMQSSLPEVRGFYDAANAVTTGPRDYARNYTIQCLQLLKGAALAGLSPSTCLQIAANGFAKTTTTPTTAAAGSTAGERAARGLGVPHELVVAALGQLPPAFTAEAAQLLDSVVSGNSAETAALLSSLFGRVSVAPLDPPADSARKNDDVD